jgi:hypothetical protein
MIRLVGKFGFRAVNRVYLLTKRGCTKSFGFTRCARTENTLFHAAQNEGSRCARIYRYRAMTFVCIGEYGTGRHRGIR